MRSVKVFFLFLVIIVTSCSKNSPVPLTADQQLQYDIGLIDQYLADHNINAIKLESGVRYVITQQGTGESPTKDNCVRFLYTGYGLFDEASFGGNTTTGLESPLKGLVPGMQIGLKQMSVGTKAVIYIPSSLAYGVAGSQDGVTGEYVIDPNECIRFEMELVQLYRYNALANYCYQ